MAAKSSDCSDRLQQDLSTTRQEAAYTKFYECLGRSADEARGWAALRVQLAEAGENYLNGSIAPAAYRAFIIDRQRKADRMRASSAYSGFVGSADSDGDLVPDNEDRCPSTPKWAPTDLLGCELKCPLRAEPGADPACVAATPPKSAEDPRGPVLEASLPVNLMCEDTTPASSAPIAWGRRGISAQSGRPPPFATFDTTSGYYFSVRRTSPQTDGCEVWYALQFTFKNPNSASAPSFDVVSVLFSSNDDENKANPAIARFPMMTNKSHQEGDLLTQSVDLPLSAGRARLRDNLFRYQDVSVRVRVVTGAQQASAWSALIVKAEGRPIEENTP
jgi:hypothetical protein